MGKPDSTARFRVRVPRLLLSQRGVQFLRIGLGLLIWRFLEAMLIVPLLIFWLMAFTEAKDKKVKCETGADDPA